MAPGAERHRLATVVLDADGKEDEWLRAIWDSSPDAMALSNPEGIVVAANPAYCALYGYSSEELVGRPFAVIFPPAARAAAMAQYREVFAGVDVPPMFESAVQRSDGAHRTVESRISFLTRDGSRIAMLSIIRDVTEQRAAATALARLADENTQLYAQAKETIRQREEFMAMAAHELKNPLAALRGFAELLQIRGAYLPRLVEGIIVQTKRMDRLIRNMLDFSLVESGRLQLQREPVDLVVLARNAVEQSQFLTRSHTVRLEAPKAPLIGDWDAGRLDQILQNLLSNAVKYAPDGGEIVVEVKDCDLAASIAVTDHGVGIAEDALPRLFDRFYRSREAAASSAGGLGLGLAITQMLVEAHGGQIAAESRLGEGSTFRVTLPYHPNEPRGGLQETSVEEDAWSA